MTALLQGFYRTVAPIFTNIVSLLPHDCNNLMCSLGSMRSAWRNVLLCRPFLSRRGDRAVSRRPSLFESNPICHINLPTKCFTSTLFWRKRLEIRHRQSDSRGQDHHVRLAGAVPLQLDDYYHEGAANCHCAEVDQRNFSRLTLRRGIRWISNGATRSSIGAPAYQLYLRGADELDYHIKNNPVKVSQLKTVNDDPALETWQYGPFFPRGDDQGQFLLI